MPLVDRRYAEALADAAEEKNILEDTQKDLAVFTEIYNNDSEVKKFFLTPEVEMNYKKNIVKNIFKDNQQSLLLPFIQLLIDKGRIKNIPGIYKEFISIADKRKNVLHLEIRTATAIDNAQLNRLKEKYRKEYKATDVKANVTVEPELLGGIVIQIGDKVIDGSIRGRLQGLKDATISM